MTWNSLEGKTTTGQLTEFGSKFIRNRPKGKIQFYIHRAFSATVAKDHGLYPEPRRIAGGGVSYVMNSRSFEDGYEVKTFSSSSLTVEAKPPLEEVQAFNQV